MRLNTKHKAAYVYFFLVADDPSISGLILRNVDRLAWKAGLALPFGES